MALLDFLNRPLGVSSGPDPQAQQNAMMGASMFEQGMNEASAMLVNLQPTSEARQLIAQSALKTNAEMAQSMRTKYFQKEMEQIRQLQLNPLVDELQKAQDLVKQRTAVAIRPVLRTVGPEEGNVIAANDAAQTASATGAPPGPPGAAGSTAPSPDGKPGQPLPTTPVPPNPALTQGQVGGVMSQDELSIMDPDTGEPVALMSDRGFKVYQEAINDYYAVNSKVQMGMMDILAQYPTNPFAQQTMGALMKNATQLAGQAVTGKTDPMEMQKWMDDRRKLDAEIEASKAESGINRFNLMKGEGQLYGGAYGMRARTANDPNLGTALTPELRERLAQGGELSPEDEARAAGAYNTVLGEDKMALDRAEASQKLEARRAAQGLLFVPQALMDKPENWMQWWERTDPTFQASMKRSFAIAKQQAITDLSTLSQTEEGQKVLTEKLRAAGAPSAAIELAKQPGGLGDPTLAEYVERIAAASGFYKGARANATADTITLAEAAQPEIAPMVDRVVANYIENSLKPAFKKEHGYDMPPSAVASAYADRHRMFAAAVSDAPVTVDPQPVEGRRITALDNLAEADRAARQRDQEAADRQHLDVLNSALNRLSEHDYQGITTPNAAAADEADLSHEVQPKPGSLFDVGQPQPDVEAVPHGQRGAASTPSEVNNPTPLSLGIAPGGRVANDYRAAQARQWADIDSLPVLRQQLADAQAQLPRAQGRAQLDAARSQIGRLTNEIARIEAIPYPTTPRPNTSLETEFVGAPPSTGGRGFSGGYVKTPVEVAPQNDLRRSILEK